MKKVIIFPFMFFILTSCGKKKDQVISVAMIPPSSQVLETDGYSCLKKLDRISDNTVKADLKAPTISYKRLEITWEKDTKLYLQVIKLVLSSDGLKNGTATCVFGADEITALFEHAGNASFSENTITAKGTYVSNPLCRVTCGGIKLADVNDPAINASGQIIIKGTEEDGDTYTRIQGIGNVRINP